MNLLKIALISLLFIGISAFASTSVDVYMTGKKLDNNTSSGIGVKFENDFSEFVLETGDKESKLSGVLKQDINTYFYVKYGLGALKKKVVINGSEKFVHQYTGGGAIGYGDNKNYNIEFGHIISKLVGAGSADGYARVSYIELLGMYNINDVYSLDVVGVYDNTRVFAKNYDNYSLELGAYYKYDVRGFVKYDSIKHGDNDYIANVGMKYIIDTEEWSPLFSLSANSNEYVSAGVKWSEGIKNKSLNMRDKLEDGVGTSDIVAQTVAPDAYASKIQEDAAVTIARANTTIGDGGGGAQPPFSSTVTNVDVGAVYSIVADPTGGMLTIDAATGAMTWDGNLFADTNFNITVKVINPDGTNASTTFVLTVINNI